MSQATLSPHLARAASLIDKGQASQARQLIQQTLRSEPRNIWAIQLMRHALTKCGEFDSALYYAEKAKAINPDDADIANMHAASLANVGRMGEAETALRDSLQKKPEHAMNQAALATVLSRAGRYVESLDIALKAVQRGLPPGAIVAPASTAMVALGQPEQAASLLRAVHANDMSNPMLLSALCQAMMLAPGVPITEIIGAHYGFGRTLARHMPAHNELAPDATDAQRPLRVGVVIGALDAMYLECSVEPALDALVAGGFQVRTYVHGPIDAASGARLKGRADLHASSIAGLSPAAIVERMLADKLDVAIDAASHTAPAALAAFHLRGAPVQITAWAYPFSSGVLSMDARLSDEHADPESDPHSGKLGQERILRAGAGAIAFRAPGDAPEITPPPAEAWGGSEGVTFGVLAQMGRVNEQMVRIWGGFIRELPKAKLIVQTPHLADQTCRTQLLKLFERAGLSPDRVKPLPMGATSAERMAMFKEVDIALDTAPMAGPVEACAALHMGVPVVAFTGDLPRVRQSNGILAGVGLGDLIAKSEEEYAEKAISLARDAGRRAELRQSLRGKLAKSGAGDMAAYGKSLREAITSARGK